MTRNNTDTAVVILLSTVGVPIEPNTAWEPAPPKAEPMSAPFPDWSRTMPMIAMQSRVCRTTSAMNIQSPLEAAAGARGVLDDGQEALGVQAGTPTRAPSISGLRDERVGVVGLDAAPVEDPHGLGRLLGGQFREEAAQVSMHLGGLCRRRVHSGPDGPHRLVGEHDPRRSSSAGDAGQARAQLSLDGGEGQPLAAFLLGLSHAQDRRHVVREHGAYLAVDEIVGLALLVPTFGVAEQDGTHPELDEHGRRDLPSVGARSIVMAVLRAEHDGAAREDLAHRGQSGRGGHSATSASERELSPSRMPVASARASAMVPCIFQLPMMSGARMVYDRSVRASTPGSARPSRNSRKAPPAVEM